MASRGLSMVDTEFLNESADFKTTELEDQVLALQWAQLRHDQFYHSDILVLPIGQRVKHFALHMAKYVGHIAEVVENDDDNLLEATLIDAFIICLACANALQLNLGEVLSSRSRPLARNLQSLGRQLADGLKVPNSDTGWLLRTMARCVGRLAKACESLDHIEDYPFRATMLDSTRSLVEVILAAACLRGIAVTEKAATRIQSMEAKHIFHGHHD